MRTALFLLGTVLALSPAPAGATFHLARIAELISGVRGHPALQYVEIEIVASLQGAVAATRLTAFSCDGTSRTILLQVPFNVTNSGPGTRWIMASPDDATFFAAAGIHPDFTFPAGIDPTCGMVCWGAPGVTVPNPNSWDPTDPDNYVDCLAYGGYHGPTKTSTHDTTPRSGTPVEAGAGDGTHSLTRVSDTQDNAVDFALACPTPANNAGATGSFGACAPPTTTTTRPTTTSTSLTTTSTTTTMTTSTSTTTVSTTTATTTSTSTTTVSTTGTVRPTTTSSSSTSATTAAASTSTLPSPSTSSTTVPCQTSGSARVLCLLERLPPAECTGQTLPATLRRQLARARRLITRADGAEPKKAARLLHRAGSGLGKALQLVGRPAIRHRLTDQCTGALSRTLGDALSTPPLR